MLAESQVKNGFDVTVLTTSPQKKTRIEIINSVKVIKAARLTTISSTPISLSLLKWVHNLRVDITHLHFPYPVGEFAHLYWGKSKRTIITYHSDIIKQRLLLKAYKPFLLRVFDKAHRIIATSPQCIKTSPYLSVRASKCVVIPLGINLSRFTNQGSALVKIIKRRYTPPLLLFVGRLCYFKGLKYLIEAMQHISATLLIVGKGQEEKMLRGLAKGKGIADRVVFLGGLSDIELPAYYKACDVFVLPSSHKSEGFGIVQIEAMAAGKPVVCTELGTGTSFVNVHGRTGLVVPPRNSSALAEAINHLLQDKTLRLELARGAKDRAKDFSKEIMVERVIAEYEKLL